MMKPWPQINILAAFNEFIHERETKPSGDPTILLFDQMILSKRNRGRASMFSKSKTDFLSDTYDHLWRTAAATPPKGRIPGDIRAIITRSTLINISYLLTVSAANEDLPQLQQSLILR